jgi:hypothetical protein
MATVQYIVNHIIVTPSDQSGTATSSFLRIEARTRTRIEGNLELVVKDVITNNYGSNGEVRFGKVCLRNGGNATSRLDKRLMDAWRAASSYRYDARVPGTVVRDAGYRRLQ